MNHIRTIIHSPVQDSSIRKLCKDNDPADIMLSKLKPVTGDFMTKLNESISCHGSISELSYSVNDSAKGLSFEEVYEKKEMLGEGGFAVVYKCVHRDRRHSYAVKEIDHENYKNAGESIKDEIHALKRLRDGPYIVKLWDVFTGPNETHLIMELMNGGDLLDRLCEKEVFSENESRRISRKLIEAVFFCHKKRIVHRDIKPENILLSSPIEDTKIKLADFGCARTFVPGEKCLRTLCGSPQYAAPELFTHVDGYDEKCDLWSIGVVVFVILGGYAPFEGDPVELPKIICRGRVEFPAIYWEEISRNAKDLIRALLVVDPKERGTLVDALDSEWLRRRDKESVFKLVSNHDGSSSNAFDAWIKLQQESSQSMLQIESSHHSSFGAGSESKQNSMNLLSESNSSFTFGDS